MFHCAIQYCSHELLFPPAFPNISSSRAIFKSSHYCSEYNPRCIVSTHCALSEFIVVPALEQRSPSSQGYFIVSPVIRFPRVRNHRGVPRYRWSRYRKRQRGRRWGESGVARKRNRRDAVECALHQAARESNRNRVKCSRVKPCRGTTSITCRGFVTATFSATF